MMDKCESEGDKLKRWSNFQLPNRFKKLGWGIIIGSFLLMMAKIFYDEPYWVKPLLRNIMLLGFLIVSISKEKIEDEFVKSLRAMSYRLALILGVLYSTVAPYVVFAIASFIRPQRAEVDEGYFQVLLYILLIQILFFNALKRSTK